jgi:hypothetical protein
VNRFPSAEVLSYRVTHDVAHPSVYVNPQAGRTMVSLRSVTAVLCAGALTTASALAQEEAEQEEVTTPARVEGHVLDEESGRGIERVEVRLIAGAMGLRRPTDGWGYFAFPNVQQGVYELLVSHIAHGTQRDSIEIEPLVVEVVRWQVSARLWGF